MDRLTQHTRYGWQFSGLPTLALDLDSHETGIYNKAAQRLAQYESTGLEPDEVPYWIPVSERLPVENEYREKDTGELIPLLVCARSTEYPFRAFYDGKNWGDGFNRIDVAHWMPLPQPPKEEK